MTTVHDPGTRGGLARSGRSEQLPNLLYSQDEEDLRASLRALLADRCPPERVLARIGLDQPTDQELWFALAHGLGLAGLLVPEAAGGAGATAREAAVVLEELGRSVAPVPFLASAVIATTVLAVAAPDDELLGELASGAASAALLVPIGTGPGSARLPEVSRDGRTFAGRVAAVAGAETADQLLVVADAGTALYAIAGSACQLRPQPSLDSTRRLSQVLIDLPAGVDEGNQGDARLLAEGEVVRQAVDRALLVGAGLLASEQVGVAQWCLDTTVDYVKQRYQFARPVGSFQAVKHRLADLWLEVSQARAAARYAADALAAEALAADSDEAEVAVAVAASFCSQVAVHAAEECIQLHGGIGMTWEHPAHLYLKRAKSSQLALGSPGRHRARLAGLIELPSARMD
jgi:alkylation response protein AidB-like acyl-CoA dehydrogenase